MSSRACIFPRQHIPRVKGFRIPKIYTQFKQYPHITNYVSTVSLGVKLDLNSIVLHISSGSREPDQFAAITLKIGNTTCLLFTTGNMVVTGAKTENDSRLAAHSYRLMLERTEHPFYDEPSGTFLYSTLEKYTRFTRFKIENIVGDTQIMLDSNVPSKNRIDLNLLDEYVGNTATSLNPEIFPGLRFSIDQSPECPISKKCLMAYIFSGAKVVIMGADVKEDIYISNDYLRNLIEPYLRATDTPDKTVYKNILRLFNATPFKLPNKKHEDSSMEEDSEQEELERTLFFISDFME